MSDDHTATRGKFRLSQEMIAIIIFGITLAALQLYLSWDIREAGRAWRAERAEETAAWEAERDQMRDEARAQRERFQRDILCPPEADPPSEGAAGRGTTVPTRDAHCRGVFR